MITHKDEWRGILVYLQHGQEGTIHPASFEMLGQASRLAANAGCAVSAVSIGKGNAAKLHTLAGCGIETVYIIDCDEFAFFREDIYAQGVIACVNRCRPSVFLLGATPESRMLAPHVAVHFRTGLTADCTGLSLHNDGGLVQTRPAFGGDLMAEIITPDTRPQMATVRQGIAEPVYSEGNRLPEIVRLDLTGFDLSSRITVLETHPVLPAQDISDAGVLVVVGRGVTDRNDLGMFAELAELIGGQLASSRSLVEKGWMPGEKQVGLSGKTIRPKVLITCGVSGSVQFMAGIGRAEHIYAMNTDPQARILSAAHTPVVGDIYKIVPSLIDKLRTRIRYERHFRDDGGP